MTFVVDGTNGLTFNNSTTQASAGVVLQVVNANTTTQNIISTASTSFVTTGISVSITPKFSTSKVFVTVNGGASDTQATSQIAAFTIYRNSTNLGNATVGMNLTQSAGGRLFTPLSMQVLDSPATTSSTTYTLYICSLNGGSVGLNTGSNPVFLSITAQEIAQ